MRAGPSGGSTITCDEGATINVPARASALPGVVTGWLLPFAIGGVAWGVGVPFPILGAPVVAILIGLAVGQVFGQRKAWAAGVRFPSRRVL